MTDINGLSAASLTGQTNHACVTTILPSNLLLTFETYISAGAHGTDHDMQAKQARIAAPAANGAAREGVRQRTGAQVDSRHGSVLLRHARRRHRGRRRLPGDPRRRAPSAGGAGQRLRGVPEGELRDVDGAVQLRQWGERAPEDVRVLGTHRRWRRRGIQGEWGRGRAHFRAGRPGRHGVASAARKLAVPAHHARAAAAGAAQPGLRRPPRPPARRRVKS
jgi:hypothetical protein